MTAMKKNIFYVGVMMVFGWPAACLYAQQGAALDRMAEARTLDSREWRQTIDETKQTVEDILQESEQLTADYDALLLEQDSLRADIFMVSEKIKTQEQENARLRKIYGDQRGVRDRITQDMVRLEKEIQDLESEKSRLLLLLEDEEAQARQWQDKLSTLQVRQRELTLELKLQEISRKELEQGRDEGLEELRDELDRLKVREAVMENELAEARQRMDEIPQETIVLLESQKELVQTLQQVRLAYEAQKKANDELMQKNEGLKQQARDVPGQMARDKMVLEGEIARLERELEDARRSIQETADVVQRKRKVMDDIMRMDAENQDLRRRIENMAADQTSVIPSPENI